MAPLQEHGPQRSIQPATSLSWSLYDRLQGNTLQTLGSALSMEVSIGLQPGGIHHNLRADSPRKDGVSSFQAVIRSASGNPFVPLLSVWSSPQFSTSLSGKIFVVRSTF